MSEKNCFPESQERIDDEILQYNLDIKSKLRQENVLNKIKDVYDICESCTIYSGNLTRELSMKLFGEENIFKNSCPGIRTSPSLDDEEKIIFRVDGECKGYINFEKTQKRIQEESLNELRQKIYEINERVRTDPETIRQKEELARKLGTISQEDLNKRMTI